MRTTVRLDDELLAEAKRYATRTGRTLTSLIDEGLREVLARGERRAPAKRVELLTGGEGGLRPGIRSDSFSEVLDQLDCERFLKLIDRS
ncbi:MAG: type II toxin-antitoxin system VapB family antitoxin [Acidobacteria bacterium]|nr:type II toxin-antitoxin system VapB family antitoxin [Acidobacteriota bacterium]